MAGNIWEWTSDWWSEDYYAHSSTDNPQGPDSGDLHVARGASWYDEGRQRAVYCRKALTPSSYRMHWVGFRCVVPAEP
jgi:formylglycine-generating enzyme required for sulfatase activity